MENKDNVQVVENTQNEKETTSPKKLTAVKIVWLVVMAVLTAWLVWGLVDVINTHDQTTSGLSLAVYLVIMVLIFGGIGYGVCALIGIVGTIVVAVNIKKGITTKGTLAWFICMIVIPIVFETAFIVVCKLIA